jgi:hypothetical protein
MEMTCHHQAVSTVVSLAAVNRDMPIGGFQSAKSIGSATPGVFHQDQARYPPVFDCPLIDPARFMTR